MRNLWRALLFGTVPVPAALWRNRCYWPHALLILYLLGALFGKIFLK